MSRIKTISFKLASFLFLSKEVRDIANDLNQAGIKNVRVGRGRSFSADAASIRNSKEFKSIFTK